MKDAMKLPNQHKRKRSIFRMVDTNIRRLIALMRKAILPSEIYLLT